MMKFPRTTLLVATTCLVIGASMQANAAISSDDFVQKASVANEFEIESSQLATQKSQNDNVRKFAEEMIKDHTKAGNDLKTALDSSKINSSIATNLDAKHQKELDKLKNDSASDFDKDYIKMQTKAHKQAVKLFKKYSEKGDNASLKNFATTTLPTLEKHLDHVKHLKS